MRVGKASRPRVLMGTLLLLGACGCRPARSPQAAPRMWGVTVDRVEPTADIVAAVVALPRHMTVRLVLDNNVPAETYQPLISQLAPKADIMAELADSFGMKALAPAAMAAKTREFLDAFSDQVAIWEVGNEVNGDWLGSDDVVAAKVIAAYDMVKARGGKTALTLSYCGGPDGQAPEANLTAWCRTRLPARMIQGLDYVFISYYEENTLAFPQPDWPGLFDRLGVLFPNSLLGIGETGTRKPDPQANLHHYYSMRIDHPRFVGGVFWWYFTLDMVPSSQPLWAALAQELSVAP